MSSFNQAIILGRLVAPPEELTSRTGKLFIKVVIATSIHQKNADGGTEERTSFIPVTIFGRTAEIFCQYVQQGDMVHLCGRLDSNQWATGSGEKRLSLSFICEHSHLLPNELAKSQPNPQAKPQAEKPSGSRPKPQ